LLKSASIDNILGHLFKSINMSIKSYFQESLQELHHVTWPTKNQAIRITIIVFIFMLVAAAIIGIVDQLLAVGYKSMLSLTK